MDKYKVIKILTESGNDKPKVIEQVTDWIKLNPVLFGLSIVTVGLVVGFVYLGRKKQNKRKKK